MNTQKKIAYALRSGRIEFSPLPEKEHRGIAICPELAGDPHYREEIETWARLAYDNKTLLVPGVPEAKSEDDALAAVYAFCSRIRQMLKERLTSLEPGDRVRLVAYKGIIFGRFDISDYHEPGEEGTIMPDDEFEPDGCGERVLFAVRFDSMETGICYVSIACLELVEKGNAAPSDRI